MAVDYAQVAYGAGEIREDPYGFYAYLRREHPVYKVPGRDEYILSTHEDVTYAARHPELFSSTGSRPAGTLPGQRYEILASMSGQDPPLHTVLRKRVWEILKPPLVKTYAPMIQEEVDRLIADFGDQREIEFIEAFAQPLPPAVIGRILGMAPEHFDQLKDWSHDYVRLFDGYYKPEEKAGLERSYVDFVNFCGDLTVDRRANPRGDAMTLLAQARDDEGQLFSIDRVANEVKLLVIGGNETTTFMMSAAIAELYSRPEGPGDLTDEKYVRRVVDETLRKESVAAWSPRSAARDIEMHGVTIPAGSKVLLMWGSGGRDEEQFERPDEFDPSRPNLKRHLGFGLGIHFCVGAALARTEATIAFRTLVQRFPSLRLSPRNEFRHLTYLTEIRALSELYLELS